MTIDGHSEIMGLGYMTGSTEDVTALTPENLATAVWSALAAANNESGTMGAKLNTASSGGVDLNALAAAVVAALEDTTIPVDVAKVNGATLTGAGVVGNEWGPA